MNSGVRASGRGTWFSAHGCSTFGNVMLTHGLNHDPESWKDMIGLLNHHGLNVYRLELTGHRKNSFAEMERVSVDRWLHDFREGFDEMSGRWQDGPNFLLGFSLGCLLPLTYQLIERKRLFAKQVLLAPAVRVFFYTRIALVLSRFVTALPSRSVSYYVANPEGTPRAAYKALFDLEKRFRCTDDVEYINIPTSVLIRPADELIDMRGIMKLIVKKKLVNWEMIPLKDHAPLPEKVTRFQHMIVDRQSCGEECWQLIEREIISKFIEGKSTAS